MTPGTSSDPYADSHSEATAPRARDDGDADWTEWTEATPSLRDHLQGQLQLCNLSERDRGLCQLLIEALDDDGYLRQSFAELAALVHADPAGRRHGMERGIEARAIPGARRSRRARPARMPVGSAARARRLHARSRPSRGARSSIICSRSHAETSPGSSAGSTPARSKSGPHIRSSAASIPTPDGVSASRTPAISSRMSSCARSRGNGSPASTPRCCRACASTGCTPSCFRATEPQRMPSSPTSCRKRAG